VLEGVFRDERGTYPTGAWLRSPNLSAHIPFNGPEGALIYVKTGHLHGGLIADCRDYEIRPLIWGRRNSVGLLHPPTPDPTERFRRHT
jgi:hypothetical protein